MVLIRWWHYTASLYEAGSDGIQSRGQIFIRCGVRRSLQGSNVQAWESEKTAGMMSGYRPKGIDKARYRHRGTTWLMVCEGAFRSHFVPHTFWPYRGESFFLPMGPVSRKLVVP